MDPFTSPAKQRGLVFGGLVAVWVAAVLAGSMFGYLVFRSMEPQPENQWDELGRAIWAVMFGGAAGVVLLIVGIVVVATKLMPVGRRGLAVFVHLVIMVPGVVVSGMFPPLLFLIPLVGSAAAAFVAVPAGRPEVSSSSASRPDGSTRTP